MDVFGEFSISGVGFEVFENWLETEGGDEVGFTGGLEGEIDAAEDFAGGEGKRVRDVRREGGGWTRGG